MSKTVRALALHPPMAKTSKIQKMKQEKGCEGLTVAPTDGKDMLKMQKMKEEKGHEDVNISPTNGKDMLKIQQTK